VNDNRYRTLNYSTVEQEKSINITVSKRIPSFGSDRLRCLKAPIELIRAALCVPILIL